MSSQPHEIVQDKCQNGGYSKINSCFFYYHRHNISHTLSHNELTFTKTIIMAAPKKPATKKVATKRTATTKKVTRKRPAAKKAPVATAKVAILGAGFGGLSVATTLLRSKENDFIIIEKAQDFGGTWRDNDYPGAKCDIQSHLYSLANDANPNWSRKYSDQGEIKAYIDSVAKKHNLHQYTRFGVAVSGASFNEQTARWEVTLENGDSIHAQYVVLGFGPLHVPSFPPIKGIDTFEGEAFHSAQWNHDYDLGGKTVIGIGTGASAIQFLPQVAPKAKDLHVMQRSPAWILPRDDGKYPKWQQNLFTKVPAIRKLHRAQLFWGNEALGAPFFHPSVIGPGEALLKRFIRFKVKDKATAHKLTPDYRLGCKRILKSNNYLTMYNRENVHLHTDGIQEITKTGLITKSGEKIDADCIIYGTGFKTDPRQYLRGMTFTGKDGVDLLTQWQTDAEGYLGVAIENFPNLFTLVGPNTNLGHNSLLFMIEAQAHYIDQCIKTTSKKGADYLTVNPDAQRVFNDKVQEQLKGTTWETGCTSWYKSDTGRNFSLWSDYTYQYWLQTRSLKENDFDFGVATG